MNEDDFQLKRNGAEPMLVETWHNTPKQLINAVFQWDNPEDIPLRIGLVGAHGTGKTSLARKLCKELEIPIIEEVARGAQDLGLRINKQTSASTQATIWISQFYEQISVPEFISDSTLLNHISYLEWQHQKLDMPQDESFLFNCLKNLTNRIMGMEYTVIFYLPIEQPPVADGVRSVDKRFQKQIDEIMVRNLDALDVEYFPLLGNLGQKCKSAMSYLENTGLLGERD